MELYLAGNFVIMGDKEKEKTFQKRLGEDCLRLGSFFYKKELNVLLSLKDEELNEKEIKSEKPKKRSFPKITRN